MITANEFRDRWGDDGPLAAFPPAATADLNISSESKAFLNDAGLPESAAPFLEFPALEAGPLPTAAEQWGLSAEFERYREIGFDGSGDPICIDESADGAVVCLNHDNNFQRGFMNSSVPQLAECLLAYRQLIRETQKRNGDEAFFNGDIPDDLKQWFHDELARIDKAALGDDCFWAHEWTNLGAM
ncbi:MAG: SUKH-4 family immunity protein [Planctomycetes bacterium]|nr:SUKH-4 family immunity protein [Planctomycetota bacterium]